ncbi:MAG: ABC transporter ATP-binding protein [Chitinophagaceae bacterium]|nr:ABC transporter ATP-binding protein [Chitinophagaceae bacterium]
MQISLSDIGKRFNRDWIFRGFSYQFDTGHYYAITGPNGSGKSTLLQVIAGAIMASEGKIRYESARAIDSDQAYKSISIAAPYQEVIEEMTLSEFFQFHTKFKPFFSGMTGKKVIEILGLERSAGKQIRYFSSGMKQRVKLAQAIFSDTPCVLFDEPCTNLDMAGISMYHQLVADYCRERLVIVSSNDKQEYGFCDQVVDIMQYK